MIVMLQPQRLLTHPHQFRMITQIKTNRPWLRLHQLAQTQLHPVWVRTMMGQGLADGLFNQLSRMVLVELQHLDKLANPGPIRLSPLQF